MPSAGADPAAEGRFEALGVWPQRDDLLMATLPDESITEIVDEVWLPLLGVFSDGRIAW
jgi:hypothetical protein